ncbi:MAG: hypothetical protein M3151_08085 [Actinomycetota bacterium]|nr:hypothetical protein [Actinomycetota bacterium]
MKGDARAQKPPHPKLVLLVALVLPGVGQVANRMPTRGLMFVFYIILLAVVTYNLTTPEHSVIGRYSGGIFVYMLSVLDAYRWSLHRYKVFDVER